MATCGSGTRNSGIWNVAGEEKKISSFSSAVATVLSGRPSTPLTMMAGVCDGT
jgi:hypothetical protein